VFFANRELPHDDVLNCAYLGVLETLTVKERSLTSHACHTEQSKTRENEVSIGQSPAERAM